MKSKPFFCLIIACTLPSMACGLFQPGFTATRTAVAQTTVAASWTDTPTSTPTGTPTATPTATETPTPTPDPCAPENFEDTVAEFHDLMVRFNTLSTRAARTTRSQLPEKITQLQDLLKTAMGQDTPPCLETLRDHQLKHMNFVIDTLIAAEQEADQQIIEEGIANARREHDEYTLELARLLGIPINTLTPTP